MSKIIKHVAKKLAYKNEWFTPYYEDVEFPDGKRGDYTKIIEGTFTMGVGRLTGAGHRKKLQGFCHLLQEN